MSKIREDVKFPGETFLEINDTEVNFERARNAALERVKKYDAGPMLVGWYDSKSGEVSPSEDCGDEESEPGWVRYAKTHGGNLTVNVNNGEYIFIFRSAHKLQDSQR